MSGVNHWNPTRIAALNTIYAVRRKEIEFENGTSNGSLVDRIAKSRAGYDCDIEINLSEYILEPVKARNIQRSTESHAKLECPHGKSGARTSQPTVVANAGIRPSGTLIDPEAGIERRNREKTEKPETITIEGAPASISTSTATEDCASPVEMLMPSPTPPPQQQQSRGNSFEYQHRRLLINSSSPMLSWGQSIHAEEPLFESKHVDCQRQTSSALSSHAASRLWTSDGLGYIREDDIVSYPGRTNVVGYSPNMPAIEIQQHTSLLGPPAPRASGFAGLSSGLGGLDSYWHAPITVPSGMGGQQYDASHYPSWSNAPANTNTSSGGDFTENFRPCFSIAGFPD